MAAPVKWIRYADRRRCLPGSATHARLINDSGCYAYTAVAIAGMLGCTIDNVVSTRLNADVALVQ